MSLSEKLIIAAKTGNSREVRKLLGRGALFTKDQFGNTALHEAAWNGNKDIVKSLLGSFCFVDSINNSGFTPLHLASQNGHAKVTKILLKWRADPCLLNQHGETALHLAAKYNHPAVVVSFSIFKVPMDIRGKEGNTALHIAAKLGNMEVMKALVHQGADPHATNVQGIGPIDFAEAGNYKDCTKLLQSAAMKSKPKPSSNDIQRSSTYSSSATDIAAAKVRMMKAMGVAKSKQKAKASTKEKKTKRGGGGGYYSEDDSSHFRSDDPSPPPLPRPRFSASQEMPDGFAYGAMGSMDHSISPLGNSSSSAGSQQSKSASIDQLLNEIEREYSGANCSSSTPQNKEKGYIKPYAEIHQLHLPATAAGSLSHGQSLQHLSSNGQAPLLSSQNGRLTKENYDILQPPTPPGVEKEGVFSPHALEQSKLLSHPHPQSSPCLRSPGKQSSKLRPEDTDTYVFMAPVTDFGSDLDVSRNSLSFKNGEENPLDLDTSSHNHSQSCAMSRLSGEDCANKNSKKAVICNYPVHTLTRHEPDSSRVPAKGILSSQSSVNEMEKSMLEKYLQDELETMRQAFQIRLGQMEKRYKKQLIAEQQRSVAHKRQSGEQAATPSSGVPVVQRKKQHNPHTGTYLHSNKRRNSWHSYISSEQELDKLALPDDPRSGSSLGIDSDHYMTDDSDIEMEPRLQEETNGHGTSNERRGEKMPSKYYFDEVQEGKTMPELNRQVLLQHQQVKPQGHIYAQPRKVPKEDCSLVPGHYKQPRKYPREGLKGGDRSWREGSSEKEARMEPQLPSMSEELGKEDETIPIDDDAKKIIQKKIDEYREKMMQYFQEKSEAQICTIEERYLRQMDEMKKKFDKRASEKELYMSNRIRDLENMLDVQTLV